MAQLLYSRRARAAPIFFGITVVAGIVAASTGRGAGTAFIFGLTVAAVAAWLVYQYAPAKVIGELDGATIRVMGREARVSDLESVHLMTATVNFVPTSRSLIFSFKARPTDGAWARSLGQLRVALPVRRIEGGRAAAESFGAMVIGARDRLAGQQPPLVEKTGVDPLPAERDDSFDPDAIMARYLATRQVQSPPATPSRPTFGRKGA
ncbi:hypothetical protein [uncultured Sphingomonas sp.]|uniref:hypothetical protein n=1 Tax=uncultured Sphingomonas sp. TaxID=158754 RepID=UPI0035CC7083